MKRDILLEECRIRFGTCLIKTENGTSTHKHQQKKNRGEADGGEGVRDDLRRTLLGLAEEVLDLWQLIVIDQFRFFDLLRFGGRQLQVNVSLKYDKVTSLKDKFCALHVASSMYELLERSSFFKKIFD